MVHFLRDGLRSARFKLILSSLAPVFLIIALRTYEQPRTLGDLVISWPAFFLLLFLLGLAAAFNLVSESSEGSWQRVEVASVQDEGAMAAAYLSGYVLPLMVTEAPGTLSWVGFGIYLVVVVMIFWRSDLPVGNPLLYFRGYRIVRVTTDTGYTGLALVLSSRRPVPGDGFSLRFLSPDVVYLKEN